jgi:uncharacterized membrane protein
MKRLLLAVLVLFILVIGVAALLGWLLPEQHVVSRSVTLAASPEQVWQLISDVQDQPKWRKELKSVTMLPDYQPPNQPPQQHWEEHAGMGTIPYVATVSDPPHHREVRIEGKDMGGRDLGFGGTWTFDLHGSATSTKLSITEQGSVHNIFFRFLSRYVFGYAGTIEQYEAQLAKAVSK